MRPEEEIILFEATVGKYVSCYFKKQRQLVVTTDYIYQFTKGTRSKAQDISEITAFIDSTNSSEFVVQFLSHVYMRLDGLDDKPRNELRTLLQVRFANKCPKRIMMLYSVPETNLRQYMNKNKQGALIVPDA